MSRAFVIALFTVILSGCTYHRTDERPSIDMPASLDPDDRAGAPLWPDAAWWRGFGSAELDALVAAAQARNLDLAAAVARVRQASAQAQVAGAPLLPAVGVGTDVSHQSTNDSSGSSSGTFLDATLTASYELDFWGRNSANAASAAASLQASRYDQQTVALTITANVATLYFQVLGLRDRLATAQENLANARSVLKQVEAQARAGTALALDVAQQRALVATQEAALPPLAQQETEALAALALLLARPPQGFAVEARTLMSVTPPRVAPGLPSELLARRPDIAGAEAQLAAADADIAAARAAMLPHIELTGAAGVQSVALAGVSGGTSLLYMVAAGLTQPLFDNGALAGQRDYAIAQRDELVARYRAAVLSAFADVQRSLAAIANLDRQRAAQETAVAQSQRAFDLATAQYRAGAADLLTVLDTQRSLFAAQDTLSQIMLARLQAEVALFKALGGGWQQETAG